MQTINSQRVEQIDVNSHPKEKHIYLSQRSHLIGLGPHKTTTNDETARILNCFCPERNSYFFCTTSRAYLLMYPPPTHPCQSWRLNLLFQSPHSRASILLPHPSSPPPPICPLSPNGLLPTLAWWAGLRGALLLCRGGRVAATPASIHGAMRPLGGGAASESGGTPSIRQ
jgi:hypothetical protein